MEACKRSCGLLSGDVICQPEVNVLGDGEPRINPPFGREEERLNLVLGGVMGGWMDIYRGSAVPWEACGAVRQRDVSTGSPANPGGAPAELHGHAVLSHPRLAGEIMDGNGWQISKERPPPPPPPPSTPPMPLSWAETI